MSSIRIRQPVLYLLVLLLIGCGRSPEPVVLSGPTMGTYYRITLHRLPDGQTPESLQMMIDERLAGINRIMSTYDPDSELSRLNRESGDDWLDISAELHTVLAEAQRISALTDGVFDVTVGPLVNLWGFGPQRGLDRIPEPQALAAARERVDYRLLALRDDPPALRKARPDLTIDLSAIAKGYGVDEIAGLLESVEVTDYLVDIGGELRARGVNDQGEVWRIGIEQPRADGRQVERIIGLRDTAMATSGDYRNFFEIDGRRYSHIIDPRTGWPVAHRLASVSVLHPSAMTADGWATGLLALGPESALALADREQLAVLLIVISDDGFETRATAAFSAATGESS